MPPEQVAARLKEARTHLEFVVELYHEQLARGLHFFHEHPATAASWKEPCVQALLRDDRVSSVIGDMCQQGMTAPDDQGLHRPVKQPTRWMSSSECILHRLSARCSGDHSHTVLRGSAPGYGSRTARAAEYPRKLCKSILRVIASQKLRDGHGVPEHVQTSIDQGRSARLGAAEQEATPELQELASLAQAAAEPEKLAEFCRPRQGVPRGAP